MAAIKAGPDSRGCHLIFMCIFYDMYYSPPIFRRDFYKVEFSIFWRLRQNVVNSTLSCNVDYMRNGRGPFFDRWLHVGNFAIGTAEQQSFQ